jgi:hypothetical protein
VADSPLAPHSSSPAELKERLQAERSGLSYLVFRDEAGKQRIAPIGGGEAMRLSIGRSASADLSVGWDPQVSGIHAELEQVGGEWTIVDDGLSRNGTFVNGERVQGRRRLGDGDTLRLGETVAVFRAPKLGDGETSATVAAGDQLLASDLSQAQRKVLIALCRPFKNAGAFATPATNKQIADELYLSVDAVKTHMRLLFQKFGIEDVPQNQKRARLVECAFGAGIVRERDL